MALPTSAAILAAKTDPDLLDRAKALGPLLGYTAPEVEAAWDRLIVSPVDNTGDSTIASVHDYAKTVYEQALAVLPAKPGANLSAVTDTHIMFALGVLKTTTPEA